MSLGSHLPILLVDDAAGAAIAFARWLKGGLTGAEVYEVRAAPELAGTLDRVRSSLVVCRARLSWTDPTSVLREARRRGHTCPALLLAASQPEYQALPAGTDAGFAGRLWLDPWQPEQALATIRAALAQADQATRAAAIVEATVDGIITIDERGQIESVNPAVSRLFGYEIGEMIGHSVDMLVPPAIASEHDAFIRRCLDTGEGTILNVPRMVQGRRKDGSTFPLDVLVSEMHLTDRRLFTGLMRDASARVRHDTELLRAQQAAQGEKLRALGQLASGVAHDLNQYLSLVIGYGDLARESLDEPLPDVTSARDSLITLTRAAMDGAEVVRRLLLFARPGAAGPPARVDLGELMADVAKLTAPRWRDAAQQEGRQIVVELELDGEVEIDGWASDLREALANLILNAVDALPSGGVIRLSARAHGGDVVAEIADNGLGMSPETRDHLFEPFFTTKGDKGSGLGMAIVFGIIERHRGTISVESTPGRGTSFKLAFPAAEQQASQQASSGETPAGQMRRILVVDDEPALVTLLVRLLTGDGHEVLSAASGEEALSSLSSAMVDLVITDLGMGPGMSGWDLAAAIRALPSPPDVILATGWGADIDPAEAVRRGVRAVIAKPYRVPDIRRALRAL